MVFHIQRNLFFGGSKLLLLGLLIVHICLTDQKAVDLKTYLQKYGYLDAFNDKPSPETLAASLVKLQYFAGIPVTGQFDESTKKQMTISRCGVKDPDISLPSNLRLKVPRLFDFRIRKRRYATSTYKWEFKDNPNRMLTWRIENVGGNFDRNTVREVMYKAFAIWTKHANIRFRETTAVNADIIVKFVRQCHYSDDYYCFDGKGGTLAHAFYPFPGQAISGDVHFDNDENFVYKKQGGTDILWVAVHELGHSLGLEHTNIKGSVMYPWYQGYKPDFDLQPDDIAGIRYLYGAPVTVPPKPTTAKPTTTPARPTTKPTTAARAKPPRRGNRPNCPRRIDAAVIEPARKYMFIFGRGESGDLFYVAMKDGLRYGPLKRKSYFPRIKGSISAAYVRPSDNRMILFSGKSYYVYKRFQQIDGPRPITELGLPSFVNEVEGALSWKRNWQRKTYLFYKYWYFRYDHNRKTIDPGYPRYITQAWRGLEPLLTEAVTGFDNSTYFIKGNKYFVLNDKYVTVKSGYPQYVGTWLHCGDVPPGGISAGSLFSAEEEPTGEEQEEP